MKRRTFVQSGVATAFGLALHPSISPLSILEQHNVHAWLRQFSVLTQSRRLSALRIASSGDLQQMDALDTYFAKRLFHRESNAVHMVSNADISHLFYPVYLRRATAGLCDILLPVFTKQADQPWQHIGTFTGFQVEALVHAAARLKDQAVVLEGLLLPVCAGTTEGVFFNYKSQSGGVSISTTVKEQATTTIRVYQGNTLLLEDTYVSKHCLKSEV